MVIRKLVFCIIFYLLPLWSFAQTLTGTVYRQDTDSVLTGASVYISGSTVGTTTDAKGQFSLSVKNTQMPLIVSSVGYYSATVNNYSPGQPLIVSLAPKQFELQEVTVRFDGMPREEKVQIFLREFIGTSEYAQSCEIVNIDDLELAYSKKTRTLTASCSSPLLIRNKKLGYNIKYFLDAFIRSPGRTLYVGNYIFTEDSSMLSKRAGRYRRKAYEGSRMQFIRGLWSGELKQQGFRIYKNMYEGLSPDSLLVNIDGLKYVLSKQSVYVTHKSSGRAVSQLTSSTQNAFIGQNGFSNVGISWSGYMAAQRIGDLLPFEYEPQP